jgi:hypothetical protein
VKNPRRTPRESQLNDLDLERWRDYEDIVTDSLWLIPARDRTGSHAGDYHGNFVPQIPNQAMRRYTKPGDIVLDTFLGSGTTLIECRKLGRQGIGVELKADQLELTRQRIEQEPNPHEVSTVGIQGDSCDTTELPGRLEAEFQKLGRERAQLVVMHPPYHSIIRFSDLDSDLSNCETEEQFLGRFSMAVSNATRFLDVGRYLVLVIGDLYAQGEWIPLGFHCMQTIIDQGYTLRSIVVKDIHNTKAKRNLTNMWRYRALAGGFYVFKHEYVMFFRKNKPQKESEPTA